jgi:hypothetical protein
LTAKSKLIYGAQAVADNILMSKNLEDDWRVELASANRHGLDHDRAANRLWTRLDVTTGLWIWMVRINQWSAGELRFRPAV